MRFEIFLSLYIKVYAAPKNKRKIALSLPSLTLLWERCNITENDGPNQAR